MKLLENTIAGKFAFYDGHAIAAVAATSVHAAKEAINEIEVEYEVLPHVIDVDEAIKPDAPVVRETLGTFPYRKEVHQILLVILSLAQETLMMVLIRRI